MTTIMTCSPPETFRIEYVDDVKRAVKIIERALAKGSTEVTAEWIVGAWKVVYKKPNGRERR